MTKAELWQHVWAGVHVTDFVLRVSVQEIRAALGDAAVAPRYLETVGGQGYRWLVGGDLEGLAPLTAGPIVGRQTEVEALEQWFQRAAQGTRQLVLVSGEAGVGKTTVVDVWLARLGAGSAVGIARGQCVEHYGEGEPYLPVLEALGQLSQEPSHRDVLTSLRRHAPLWLVQLPGLLSDTELERLQRQVQGATAARMLRELAEALEVLTAEVSLVLVLEDLQWSDHATVELLAYLAQRRAPARLLVLGTYRPAETVLRGHPLRPMVQELCGRGQAVELCLGPLPADEVAAYVAGRLGGPVTAPLAAFVHERTEGNALFIVNLVAHLVQQGLLDRRTGEWTLRAGSEAIVMSLPEGLRQFLVRRIEALRPEERQVLEAASVVGEAFAAAAVAAGAECPVADVEARCDALAAQHHFLEEAELTVWPDGTRAGGYRFQHALYQQVLYEQLGIVRRMQLHQRIGARLEAGYGARAGDIAAQLAVHFERGGETYRAVHYWQQAGDNAAQRHAYHEAIVSLRKGLALLATLPDSPERTQHAVTLYIALGAALQTAKGLAAPEVEQAYTQAYALCQQVGETPALVPVLFGLWRFYGVRSQLHTARELGDTLLRLAQHGDDPALAVVAHTALGVTRLNLGALPAARLHLEEGIARYTPDQRRAPVFRMGQDPGVACRANAARVLWLLGYPEQALIHIHEALTLAHALSHPFSLAWAQCWAAFIYQFRRDVPAVHEQAEAAFTVSTEQGFPQWAAYGTSLRGWALALQGQGAEGLAQVRQGIAAMRVAGAALFVPYFCAVLADVSAHLGHTEDGLQALAEAHTLVEQQEERWWEAEIHRLRGVLLLRQPETRRRRRKPGCNVPWTSPAVRRRNRSSYAPL